jgi:hypothetical protein
MEITQDELRLIEAWRAEQAMRAKSTVQNQPITVAAMNAVGIMVLQSMADEIEPFADELGKIAIRDFYAMIDRWLVRLGADASQAKQSGRPASPRPGR